MFTDYNILPAYFLGANSAKGFINGFSSAYDPYDGWRAYIIKGGPGTGKSSFMKMCAAHAAVKGINTHISPCSSDPDSLDAVIMPDIKIIIMDGTAPHTVNPKYPGVCEQLLDFGQFWDAGKLQTKREEIIKLTDENRMCHKKASEHIAEMGRIMRRITGIALSAADRKSARKFGERLAVRFLKPKGTGGTERICYLGAVTPKGTFFLDGTVDKLCEKKVIISDRYGAVSNIILSGIRKAALAKGYNIITVPDCVLAGKTLSHLIIPDAGIAFCTEGFGMSFADKSIRRIHADRFTDNKIIKEKYGQLIKDRRLLNNETSAAVAVLKQAKELHDKLEELYIDAMNFEALNEFGNKFIEKISP